jgi:flavodoxin
MIKRTCKVLIGLALTAGLLTGCGAGAAGNSSSSASAQNSTQEAQSETSVSSQESTQTNGSGTAESTSAKKVLVVYYSASGNTRTVAQTVADATDADIFEITPSEPYTDDDLNWTDNNSRVTKEHENPDLQNQVELTTAKVDNWDSYDTVFIGYPIWWGIAAWPVNQFVQNNDFSGKTVIPFCTSLSSGIGESGDNLAKMAGSGNWKDGQRFSSSPDSSEVTDWAKSQVNA